MKRDLQRIEATLDQLANSSPPSSPHGTASKPKAAEQVPSFEVRKTTEAIADTPILPRVKSPSFTSHRNAANPALAMTLLKDIEGVVSGWQAELQEVLRQVQDVYLEGPIIDGWLESYGQDNGSVPALRHTDVECLMDYVEKHWGAADASLPPTVPPTPEPNTPGYRLCGLNDDGQLWFRHCPLEQVAAVSVAIARFQKLRQLLVRKQSLETRLAQLAETLVRLHSQLVHERDA